MRRRDQDIIGVEIRRQALYCPHEALWSHLILCHHSYSVVHDGVHNKVEDLGQEGIALCHDVEALERVVVISSGIFYHGETGPVCM